MLEACADVAVIREEYLPSVYSHRNRCRDVKGELSEEGTEVYEEIFEKGFKYGKFQ